MAFRISKKERAAAQKAPSYLAVPGPAVPHHNKKLKLAANQPNILLPRERTLVQGHLPPLPAASTSAITLPLDNDVAPPPSPGPFFFHPDRFSEPPPDPTKHQRKRLRQWQRWQQDVLPGLLPHLVSVLHETRSLRDVDKLLLPVAACSCGGVRNTLKVTILRFTVLEDVELTTCQCATAVVQLMQFGVFACAPLRPTLAVDLRVLEFAMDLFVHVAPNNTAWCSALEGFLAKRGYQLTHKHSLRRRFGNCLMWYTHLTNMKKKYLNDGIERFRTQYLATRTRPPGDSEARRRSQSPATPRQGGVSTSPSKKRVREHTPDALPQVPFPDPPPCTRPSEYLRRRCPACFGDLRHDPALLADVMVCTDACFTQKKKKTPRDPPKTHPTTRFVPEVQAVAMERYIDAVRTKKRQKKPRVTVMEVDDEEDSYEPHMNLPRSVLDACESSFKAADEKREKASTQFFEDTGVMALLCRHDRVLWLVNMHSAGEKQFNVLVLLETLFQHLPPDVTVGALYDIVCNLERSCRLWGFLGRYLDRLAFAVSVFHAFGHEWACQLLYHPRKRKGFGFTNGEGCERFWHSISHLIAHLRICGYHNRLYTLDTQIENAEEASLLHLGEWIRRRDAHSIKHRAEAVEILNECNLSLQELRAEWRDQVATQTKPLPRRSKNKGQQAVNAVVLLQGAIKTRKQQVREYRTAYLDAVEEEDEDAHMHKVRFEAAEDALAKAEGNLKKKKEALGITDLRRLKSLENDKFIGLCMNARALKRRLRDHLRSRKFKLDRVERSCRRLLNGKLTLDSHTESAVKCREPTIKKLNVECNKLCSQMAQLIATKAAPKGAVAPVRIESEGLFQLDVDDGIWQDVGLDEEEEGSGEPPGWLSNEDTRSGIKAMLEYDRANEENIRLRKERCAMQVWFAEEWAVHSLAIEQTDDAGDKYQFQLLRDRLAVLCATWDRTLPDLQINLSTLPPWGPTAEDLSRCDADAHQAARGEERTYGRQESDDEDDGGEDHAQDVDEEDIDLLDTFATAEVYREANEY
ncbi:hypothetical protein C8J57DRAFT_1095127 [Mycena rebaudengoi]|nr:hypothetical protein C8J57DRAFT_1095127 [Mycena rebaudengoi]